MKNFSCLFLVMFVLSSAAVAEEQSKVFDSFAEEMLETLDSNVKVAIQPLNSKKVDLPKKITTGFNNRLVDSLLKKSNANMSYELVAGVILWKQKLRRLDKMYYFSIDFV